MGQNDDTRPGPYWIVGRKCGHAGKILVALSERATAATIPTLDGAKGLPPPDPAPPRQGAIASGRTWVFAIDRSAMLAIEIRSWAIVICDHLPFFQQ